MRNLLLLATCILLLGRTAFAQEWPSFKSTDENFSISLPAQPKQERTTGKTPFGNGHHIYNLDSNGVSFTISVSVFEKAPTQEKDIKRTLDMARDLQAVVIGGKLLTDSNITLDGFPGRLVQIEKDKTVWTLRAFIVKQHMYQLLTTAVKAKDANPAVEKFFGSFKLLRPPE